MTYSILGPAFELLSNRFTERATEAMARSIEIMRRYGHDQLGTEHMLLALLEQPGGFASQALFKLNVDVGMMHGEVEGLLSALSKTTQVKSSVAVEEEHITSQLKSVLSVAEKEAMSLKDEYISTEHLFLAISTEQNTAVSQVLVDNDVTHERIGGAIRQIRGTQIMTNTATVRSLRVFLCHSSADKPSVRELYQRLCADGFEPWLDEENLLPGQDWQREIPRAVRQSDAVIVCLSKGSINKAGYVQKEIKFALDVADEQPEDTIFLIPLKLEECDVPERLTRWHWVDLFSPHGYERLMKSLRSRANSLGMTASLVQTSSSSQPSPASQSSSISNVSGGVNVDANNVTIGNDVVGRDKIIQANTYIEHATIVQSSPPIQTSQVARSLDDAPVTNIQTWGGVDFVRIPAGKFLMGSKDDNPLAQDDEKPQHSIEIPHDYWLARCLVTNEQFARFVEETAHEFIFDNDWKVKAVHPVAYVSWHEAMAYCKWLAGQLSQEFPVADACVRLPSEAEWEKAARGEYGNEWPWGNEFDPNKCNSIEGGKKSTTPVGAYSPQGDSPYGIADLAGNVWEWTISLWRSGTGKTKYTYPYQFSDGREKLDESDNVPRVLRGGAFGEHAGTVRGAKRHMLDPRYRSVRVGFRVAVAPELG